jgi:hypothetical protein
MYGCLYLFTYRYLFMNEIWSNKYIIIRTTDSYNEAEIYFLKALKTLERWRFEDGSVRNGIHVHIYAYVNLCINLSGYKYTNTFFDI